MSLSFTSDICSFSTLPWRLFIISTSYQRHLLHQREIPHSPRVLQFLHLFFNGVQGLFSPLLGTMFIIWECTYWHFSYAGTDWGVNHAGEHCSTSPQSALRLFSKPTLQTGETLTSSNFDCYCPHLYGRPLSCFSVIFTVPFWNCL